MNDIAFENKEVSRDKKVLQEMYKLSGQHTTPVIIINGHAYAGFDREMIKHILQKERETEQTNAQNQSHDTTS